MRFGLYVFVLMLVASSHGKGLPAVPAWQGSAASSDLGSPGTLWGGQHLVLEVTSDGANLEFDCATGTISGAPSPDAQGEFTIGGTLVRERPGPTMRDGNPTARAKYSGRIQGETMQLVVRVEGSTEPYGEYVLTRGKAGRVVKCR